MGVSKPLVRGESGQTLLARAITTARQAELAPFVAVRAGKAEVAAEVKRAGARVVEVPDADEGMAASIRVGVAAVEADAQAHGLLIMLADQWQVTANDLRALVAAWETSPSGLAAARYEGVLGVPAAFSRGHFAMLQRLTGDKGARQVLRERERDVAAVEMPSAAVDADVPDDLQGLGEP